MIIFLGLLPLIHANTEFYLPKQVSKNYSEICCFAPAEVYSFEAGVRYKPAPDALAFRINA